jgi:hypothetical protein
MVERSEALKTSGDAVAPKFAKENPLLFGARPVSIFFAERGTDPPPLHEDTMPANTSAVIAVIRVV